MILEAITFASWYFRFLPIWVILLEREKSVHESTLGKPLEPEWR